jgi:tRNA A37 threonylcarbamoyladenosine modification protein TsaB
LKKNNLNYFNLDNVVVVNGPWSFTWIRTIVLVVNTINYIIKKNITSLSYFDLFKSYPIVKSSSKRDCFLQKSKDSKIEIIENNKLKEFLQKWNIKEINWEINKELFTEIKILDKINYTNIIKTIEFKKNKKIEALYIKKPNIS